MINNFKKPNLNAPRYREKVFGLLNADLINEFKDKNPIYSNIDNSKLKNIINLFNERIWKEVIKNRDGVQLPDSLGYIFIGTSHRIIFSRSFMFQILILIIILNYTLN